MPRANDGMGKPLPIAPLACIPTTCGTGSEVSMGAVIKDNERKVKLEIADFPLFPRLAILDPESTRTLPPAIAAVDGDGRDDARDRGLRLAGLEPVPGRPLAGRAAADPRQLRASCVETPEDEEARGQMLIAASLAITISLGSTHSMSHPAALSSAFRTASPTRSTCRT